MLSDTRLCARKYYSTTLNPMDVHLRLLEPTQELGVALAGVAAVVVAGHQPRQDVDVVLTGVDILRNRGYRNLRLLLQLSQR